MDFGSFFATYFFIYLLVNGALAFIPAKIAQEKGRSWAAFWWLSFLTTILIGLIAALAMPALEKQLKTVVKDQDGRVSAGETELPEVVKCPYCAEMVKFEAVVCRFCGKDIGAHTAEIRDSIAANQKLREQQEKVDAKNREIDELRLKNDRDAVIAQKKNARKDLLLNLRRPVFFVPVAAVLLALAALFAINQGQQLAKVEAENAAVEAKIRDSGSEECAGALPAVSENDLEISVRGSIDVTAGIVVFGREFRCIANALSIDWTAVGQQIAALRDSDGNISAGQFDQANLTFRWESGFSNGYGDNSTKFPSFQIVLTK